VSKKNEYFDAKLRFTLFNPCGESYQLIVHLNLAKNGFRREAKKREA